MNNSNTTPNNSQNQADIGFLKSPYTGRYYGTCSCGGQLDVTEWYTESEYDRHGIKTGRVRTAASSLYCTSCLKKYCIDDSFDGPWYNPKHKVSK